MNISHIDHFVLTVKDLDRTLDFYTRVLGMEKVTFGQGRVALKFGGQKFNLHEAGREFQPNAENAVPGSMDICLITESEIESTKQHLEQQGVKIIEGPVERTGSTGTILSLYVRDPDQNLVEIAKYGANQVQEFVPSSSNQDIHRSTCHCGSVELELYLPDGIVDPRRCSCSICSRRGAIVASVPLENLKIVQGADQLRMYTFNTHTAKHYFCSVCGIYTHHQRRSDPDQYGFNVACLEGFDLTGLGEIPVYDGVNHPSDRLS